jgi:hypothetical protein
MSRLTINKDEAFRSLHWAARSGDEVVVLLLTWEGSRHEDEQTALHVAAKNRRNVVTWLLLEKGANIVAKIEMDGRCYT